MPYGELIKEAFRIVIGHRYLWPFGLFAGTSFSINVSVPVDDSNGGSPDDDSSDGFLGLELDVLLLIGLGILALGVFFVALSALSHGALAHSVAAIRRGERPGFRGGFSAGRSAFWRVLGLGVLLVVIAFGLLLAVAVPLVGAVVVTFAVTEAPGLRALAGVGAGLAGLASLVVVFLSLFMIAQLALRELVLGGRRPVESLRGGWRLLRGRLGHSLLLVLIQQGIAIGAGLVLLLALALLSVPAIVLAIASEGVVTAVAVALTVVVLLPLALAGFGAIGAFGHAFWTLGYLRLVAPEPLPSERPY